MWNAIREYYYDHPDRALRVVLGFIVTIGLVFILLVVINNSRKDQSATIFEPLATYRTDVCINTDTHTYAYFKAEYNGYIGTIITTVGKNGDLVTTSWGNGKITAQYALPMNLCKWKQSE